mmetsp:Transcript_37820/g.94914  ORF Transcript_37820/g.94914 Transcript_37820/m.94914 type:complete len:297 (+) Transcript_37820:1804-2694(+)
MAHLTAVMKRSKKTQPRWSGGTRFTFPNGYRQRVTTQGASSSSTDILSCSCFTDRISSPLTVRTRSKGAQGWTRESTLQKQCANGWAKSACPSLSKPATWTQPPTSLKAASFKSDALTVYSTPSPSTSSPEEPRCTMQSAKKYMLCMQRKASRKRADSSAVRALCPAEKGRCGILKKSKNTKAFPSSQLGTLSKRACKTSSLQPQGSGCVWFLQACDTAMTMSFCSGGPNNSAGTSWQRGIGLGNAKKASFLRSWIQESRSGWSVKGCCPLLNVACSLKLLRCLSTRSDSPELAEA